MRLLEDTRQQAGKHEEKHAIWKAGGVQLRRCKLPYGDYCLPPKKAVDTKADMAEIAQNIGGAEHRRFINECKAALEDGCELFILVENTDGIEDIEDVQRWVNPRTEYSPKCIQGPRLAKAMYTIQERYGCTFLFCKPEEAAEMIVDLLR